MRDGDAEAGVGHVHGCVGQVVGVGAFVWGSASSWRLAWVHIVSLACYCLLEECVLKRIRIYVGE